MTANNINKALGITESYQMPEALMRKITGPESGAFFDLFQGEDQKTDYFRDYFQENQSNRDKMKQDYTPDPVCKLVNILSGDSNNCLDLCSGTGALTVSSSWDGFHRCEEISKRAIPVLLFNLAIRGIEGEVASRDTISGETSEMWRLERFGKYSQIIPTDPKEDQRKYDKIISNPPYSLKIKDAKAYESDPRFSYGITPNGFSDFLFVEDAISRLSDTGTAVFILPHGVLFRGNREEGIRKALIHENLIDSIIGLPDHMFLNTGIPVFLMILKKNRELKDILFLDASNEFEKDGKQNVLRTEDIEKITDTVKNRREIQRYSHMASLEEIEENGFNLNIPRYVDTYIPEPVEPLDQIFKEIAEIESDIRKTSLSLYHQMEDMSGTDTESNLQLRRALKIFKEVIDGPEEQKEMQAERDRGNIESLLREDLPGRNKLDRALSNERANRNHKESRTNREPECRDRSKDRNRSLVSAFDSRQIPGQISFKISDDNQLTS